MSPLEPRLIDVLVTFYFNCACMMVDGVVCLPQRFSCLLRLPSKVIILKLIDNTHLFQSHISNGVFDDGILLSTQSLMRQTNRKSVIVLAEAITLVLQTSHELYLGSELHYASK